MGKRTTYEMCFGTLNIFSYIIYGIFICLRPTPHTSDPNIYTDVHISYLYHMLSSFHAHPRFRTEKAAHIKNTKMAAWRETRNCQREKIKQENKQKDVKIRFFCKKLRGYIGWL